jgi:hypothetical protein
VRQRRVASIISGVLLTGFVSLSPAAAAWAASYTKPSGSGWICGGSQGVKQYYGQVVITCSEPWSRPAPNRPKGPGPRDPGGPTVHVKTPDEIYKEKVSEIEKRNAAEIKRYREQIESVNNMYKQGDCGAVAAGSSGVQSCPIVQPPQLIPVPDPPPGVKPAKPEPLPPLDAAYLALATKLSITPSGVGIGPNPDASRWKQAVVGHSYWLWANGPTHLGPVSDSQAGYTVSLDATLAGTTFEMGDGGVVKCKGAGTPYPGDAKGLYAKSPTCGYVYKQTSRHRAGGTYPVRATTTWSVAYSTPLGSGTIPIVLSTVRDLKVGELQTVIGR